MTLNEAFTLTPRTQFLTSDTIKHANEDRPLPIGYGQTNSQPSTVRAMLEWLDPKPGEHVLDVGSGSGWTSALLARLVGETGSVVAIELVPELVAFGKANCQSLGITTITFHEAGAHFGWPAQAPYDRILVSASASRLPSEIIGQLRPGGKLVIPINYSIHEITKCPDGGLDDIEHTGYTFVPLIEYT